MNIRKSLLAFVLLFSTSLPGAPSSPPTAPSLPLKPVKEVIEYTVRLHIGINPKLGTARLETFPSVPCSNQPARLCHVFVYTIHLDGMSWLTGDYKSTNRMEMYADNLQNWYNEVIMQTDDKPAQQIRLTFTDKNTLQIVKNQQTTVAKVPDNTQLLPALPLYLRYMQPKSTQIPVYNEDDKEKLRIYSIYSLLRDGNTVFRLEDRDYLIMDKNGVLQKAILLPLKILGMTIGELTAELEPKN